MSDSIDLTSMGKKKAYDPPDSPNSVGWTHPMRVRLADEKNPLPLDCGELFYPVDVEYELYGKMSPAKDNVILIAHALSGDAHAAGWCADADRDGRPWRKDRPGWWDSMIGPGKAFDTDRYAVLCANVLGSCYGTTGPMSLNPRAGRPYGLTFPVVTVEDWVRLQERLITHLGIEKLLTISGGSLGGQQAIEWGLAFPNRVRSSLVMAATPHLSAQGLGFNHAGRHAILSDPNFKGGDYYGGAGPDLGLAVARMIGHITYLSEVSLTGKFGRRLQKGAQRGFQLSDEYEVESYLKYQSESFVRRFDGNAYLYITRAMDYYDAADHTDGDLVRAMAKSTCEWMFMTFTSDWLYPPSGTMEMIRALEKCGRSATYASVDSPYGHDSFLLEPEKMKPLVAEFLEHVAKR